MIIRKKTIDEFLNIISCLVLTFICSAFQNNNLIFSLLIVLLMSVIVLVGYKHIGLLFVFSFLFGDYMGGMLPINITIFSFHLNSSDISIILLAYIAFVSICRYGKKLKFTDYVFIIIVLAITTMASYQATKNTGQSFLRGFFTQRRMLSYVFLPIILRNFSSNRSNEYLLIEKSAYTAAVILIVIYVLQYILLYIGDYHFLNCNVSKRFSIRLHVYPRTLFVAYIFLLNKLFNQNISKQDYRLIFWSMICIALIGQYRMMFLGCVIIGYICLVLKRGNTKLFKFMSIFCLIIFIPLANQLIDFVNDNTLGAVSSETVRGNALKFYNMRLSGHELFGYGAINNTSGVEDELLGTDYGFYLIDLGAFVLKFFYGNLVYALYYIVLIWGIIKEYLQIRNSKNIIMFLLFVYMLATSYTLLTAYYYPVSIILIIIFAINLNRKQTITQVNGENC